MGTMTTDTNGSDQRGLINSLIENGYAVDKARNIVRAYVRDSHRAFTISDLALEHGYVMTGFKGLGRDQEFFGYTRLHPAKDVGIAGYTIESAEELNGD